MYTKENLFFKGSH